MFHIGLDDTDSKEGMCTTYLGALLKDELADFSKILSLKLVRLNPNIEWKTRGNGSIGLAVETED
ncbi:MAG: tRNA(Ile2) 2-agmatinylcytidine synthetase, partial [Candidatus Hydrothermarchaeales archaeon]